jgi:hypothetical protein
VFVTKLLTSAVAEPGQGGAMLRGRIAATFRGLRAWCEVSAASDQSALLQMTCDARANDGEYLACDGDCLVAISVCCLVEVAGVPAFNGPSGQDRQLNQAERVTFIVRKSLSKAV